MAASDGSHPFPWRDAAAMSMVLVGLLVVALSLVFPRVFASRSRWSEEQAIAYQTAAAKLHQLSMESVNTPAEKQTRNLQNELAVAQSEYAALRDELETARAAPHRLASVLRYGGLLLAVIGVAGLLAKRSSNAA
jgi:hypothetical protein